MTLIWRPGYITAFADPDVQSYLTRVEEADNQALEYPVAVAIDEFVRGCKADGIWTAIKASCIMAGARTLAGALQPLVGTAPTNFNFVAGDYNRKTGLLGNGTTKYLNSNYAIPTANQNNTHAACRASSISGGPQFLLGDNLGAGAITTNISVSASTNQVFSRVNQNAQTTTSEAPTEGVYGVSRSGAASYSLRFNGSTRSVTESSATPAGFNIGLFTRTVSPTAYFAGRIAFYSIGESLNLALLDARVTTLINRFSVVIP